MVKLFTKYLAGNKPDQFNTKKTLDLHSVKGILRGGVIVGGFAFAGWAFFTNW